MWTYMYWFLTCKIVVLRHIQTSHPVWLSSNMEAAYTFLILYNFCIGSHRTYTHCAFHWIEPNQLYRWIYEYFLLCWAVGMSTFTPFSRRINLSIMSLFSRWFTELYFVKYLLHFLHADLITLWFLHVLYYHICFWFDTNYCFLFNS